MAQGACHHGSTRDASQRVYPTGFIHYRRAVIRTAVREGLLGAERLAPSGPTSGCWQNRGLGDHATTAPEATQTNVRTLRSLSLSCEG